MKKGLYERVADRELVRLLEELDSGYDLESIDDADSHVVLGEHLSQLVTDSLRRVPSHDRLGYQRQLINDLIDVLAGSSYSDHSVSY